MMPLTRPSATFSPLTGLRTLREARFVALLPARGEKVREARMRGPLFLMTLLLACSHPETAAVTDTREPIGVQYVGAPEMPVHKWARDDSPVVSKFLNGESVSILARRGDWIEVRTAGGSGFAHAADVTDAAQAQKDKENPSPKFQHIPSPVTSPGAHGIVYIEASVNTEGEITGTQIIENSTGQPDLGERNAEALKRARFYPMVIKGQRKSFLYDYRVDY